MKNRAKLLCLKLNISVDVFALRVGISKTMALGIWEQQIVIPNDVITRACQVLECTEPYFLCLCETNHYADI